MRIMVILIALAALVSGIAPAIAQTVPALADAERRTTYTPSAQTGPFDVGFHIYGSGTVYGDWIEVWLNGVKLTPITEWTLSLSSGTLATAARPLTNARVTLVSAGTGTLQIVGARRPTRTSQFLENQGVSARSLNQIFTDIIAQNRETWDKTNDVTGRALIAPPGDTLTVLPAAATRAGSFLAFDSSGNPSLVLPSPGLGNVVGPIVANSNDLVRFDGTTGTLVKDTSDEGRIAFSRDGGLNLVSNMAGVWPSELGFDLGVTIGNNFSIGQAEVNFINTSKAGAGPRSFTFSQQTGASAGTDLMWINRNGGMTSLMTDDPTFAAALLLPYGDSSYRTVVNGGRNGIVGVTTTAAGDGAVFPTGVTGSSVMLEPGGVGFGLFGTAWNANYDGTGAVNGSLTNELNTFNFFANPPGTYPPDRGFGIPHAMPIILTIASGGSYKSEVGIQIGREGSRPQKMNTGIYMNGNGVDLYGLLIDSSASFGTGTGYVTSAAALAVGQTVIPLVTGTGTILAGDNITFATDPHTYTVVTGIAAPGSITIEPPGIWQAVAPSQAATIHVGAAGPNIGAFIRNYGTNADSANIFLQTVGPAVPANKVIVYYNTGGDALFYTLQSGAVVSSAYVQTGTYTFSTLPTCGAGTKGARALISDNNVATFMTNAAGSGANTTPVFCNGVGWVTG